TPSGSTLRMSDSKGNCNLRFRDQVALVVGGANGIGKAIAERLGREGANVIILDIDKDGTEATICEMVRQGSKVQAVACDVCNSEDVRAAVEQVVESHGHIDILMEIAGIAQAVPFLELDEETWDKTLDTNLRGAFLLSKAV